MNIKVYEEYKPIVNFIKLGQDVCYKYQEEVQKVDLFSLNELKNKLELPYKVSFEGISRSNIGRILKDLIDEDTNVFCYRVKNPKNNLIKFYAIFTKKIKTKKLEK